MLGCGSGATIADFDGGCERAVREVPLRSNTVHPLTRKPTGTNTGEGIPVIKLDFVESARTIEILMAPS